jgi:hypothetical protein
VRDEQEQCGKILTENRQGVLNFGKNAYPGPPFTLTWLYHRARSVVGKLRVHGVTAVVLSPAPVIPLLAIFVAEKKACCVAGRGRRASG